MEIETATMVRMNTIAIDFVLMHINVGANVSCTKKSAMAK